MYNIGTITTTANSNKVTGTNTKWKDNNSLVSAEQVILIQNGSTIYINNIASIQSNTEMTLSFPVPAATKNVPYNILTTMVNSVSDAANKIVAMNNANVQFSDILNRWMTESGTITVTLPDGTTQQLRTAKEQDKLLNGKLDTDKPQAKGSLLISAPDNYAGLTLAKLSGEHVKFETLADSSTTAANIVYRDAAGKNISIVGIPKKSGTLMHIGDFGWGGNGGGRYSMTEADFTAFITDATNATQVFRNSIATKYSQLNTTVAHFRTGNLSSTIAAGFGSNKKIIITGGDAIAENINVYELYHNLNTTKDSNGNLKAASPIVKVFADHIENNDESEGVTMQKLGIGHYLIKGVVGFNADGAWGINNGFVIPQDHNGKNMVLIDYDVKPDGDIEIFVFHQQNADMPERFQNKRIKHFDEDGQPIYFDNYEPCDVPDSRWIDMRVEMPVNSIYNIKKAESERLAKLEAERVAKEEVEKAEREAAEREQYGLGESDVLL